MPLGMGISLMPRKHDKMPRSLMENFAIGCWVNWLSNQSSLLVRIKSSTYMRRYMVTCICVWINNEVSDLELTNLINNNN